MELDIPADIVFLSTFIKVVVPVSLELSVDLQLLLDAVNQLAPLFMLVAHVLLSSAKLHCHRQQHFSVVTGLYPLHTVLIVYVFDCLM